MRRGLETLTRHQQTPAEASELREIVVTDTVPVNELRAPQKLRVLTVSGILAETIQNVFADDSVSAIFAGENQLF